jgi:hypothetical protein
MTRISTTLKRSEWLSKSEVTTMIRNMKKERRATDAYLRKYGEEKTMARAQRIFDRRAKMYGKPEHQIVVHLSWVVRNNPGVETNLLRGHLALLIQEHGGEYLWPTSSEGLTKLPTNKEIIAMLRRSGLFRTEREGPSDRAKGFGMAKNRYCPPLHWWYVGKKFTAKDIVLLKKMGVSVN